MVIVGNETLDDDEANELLRMVIRDACQVAGTFHGENRSPKFRANWPDENVFARSEWRNFIEATLMLYAQALNDPHRDDSAKRRMYLATILWNTASAQTREKFLGEQIIPNTEKFHGDRHEHARTTEMFGKHAMTFAELALPHKRFN